jgi:hypothetical protein
VPRNSLVYNHAYTIQIRRRMVYLQMYTIQFRFPSLRMSNITSPARSRRPDTMSLLTELTSLLCHSPPSLEATGKGPGGLVHFRAKLHTSKML